MAKQSKRKPFRVFPLEYVATEEETSKVYMLLWEYNRRLRVEANKKEDGKGYPVDWTMETFFQSLIYTGLTELLDKNIKACAKAFNIPNEIINRY